MKILRVTSLGFESGGAENGIVLLQPIFEAMGHAVKTLASDYRPEQTHFNDFEFKALKNKSRFLKLFYRSFYPQSFFALRKVLKEFQPDIVQLHTMDQVSPSVLFLLKKYPAVMTIHGAEDFTTELLLWGFPPHFFKDGIAGNRELTLKGWLHYVYHKYINGKIYHAGFRYIDAFIVFSRYMQRETAKDGLKCDYVQNATKLFEPVPIDVKSRYIMYAGRIEQIKGVEDLINAIPAVLKKHPETKLLVAGKGNYLEKLKEIVDILNIKDSVEFLGFQNREQLYELYKKSVLVVVPSIWPEPFGKIGIEAMSVGRPVIAANVGGISEWLVDGKNGFLVDPRDPKAIAKKILKLFSDKNLLEAMSLNAVKHAKNFSIEHHAENVLKLYADVIARKREK